MGHSSPVQSVAFGPAGRTIVTACFDKTTRVWDATTARPLGPPMIHSDAITSVAISPDGKMILIGCQDSMARLWDAATGQPIGPPMQHSGRVVALAFSADGRFLLTSDGSTARQWDAPTPLPDDVRRLTAWVEVATAMELDERGSVRVLDGAAWLERRRRLEQLGGPPPEDPAPRFDPILFGSNPAARGDAWKERGQWDRAEAAYAEAATARPSNAPVRYALARLHAESGRPGRAAATLVEAVRLIPHDVWLRRLYGLALLGSGDRAGSRRSNAALLNDVGATVDAWTANEVAWACALGPDATDDPERPVRLAEAAVKGATQDNRANSLMTLGAAALYRAGRYNDAMRRLEEVLQTQGGTCGPRSRALLAMTHHRLGHRDEARRWLDRLREYRAGTDSAQFWFRTGGPPAPQRGRGRRPLRSGVPRRPVRTLRKETVARKPGRQSAATAGIRGRNSFPRSAWECRPRRSASSGPAEVTAERPRRRSHAERGNEFPVSSLQSQRKPHFPPDRVDVRVRGINPRLAARPACGKLEIVGGPSMSAQLPADLEQFVQAQVRSGRFTSSDEAITEAVRLLRQQEEAEEARVREGIRQSLEDMRAGRTQPLAEAFADIRRDLNMPQGS